ncbi:glutamyl-tRNA amidotransferase [Candidatus Cerribacteria bacterium 'Amazon FNV 2010 28 9']|uniref:Glutamyl-tRNA amidotransferase n=1 Tax=Candidatus Cerribacteria bacterium 'Amazon FNV 2010 28 9' TaxID=2081795 RepID=A0A317JP17_9BACT|nr:MAG: glutamyl-tRNA amidotransferase [Candidatus Cerribacteria bacterium 'Amazon FNV 2010 28 9']
MIRQQITDQLKDAMRAHDGVKLETLRYVLSQIKYVEIDKKHELSDDEVISVCANEVKKRREAIELFKKSGRDELVREEDAKLAIILALMPKQLTRDEIITLVDDAIAKIGKENMGALMKVLQPQVKGKADGKLVSEIVKERMTT